MEVGALPTLQHGVSGTLFLVGTKSLKIRDFYYDGQGPGKLLFRTRKDGGEALGGLKFPLSLS